jgi:hypothetical protein
MTAIDWFWTILVYVVVLGLGALGGVVTRYWLVTIPDRELKHRR